MGNPDYAFVDRALEKCLARGFDAAQARCADQELHELEALVGKPTMLRTVNDVSASLVGIKDGKRGSIALNKKDDAALDAAVDELWELTRGSLPDDANALNDSAVTESFEFGPQDADYDAMYAGLDGLLGHAARTYPLITLGSVNVDFTRQDVALGNSHGVRLDATHGRYGASAMFTAREGTDVSSFNYSGFVADALDRPLHERGTFDTLLAQSSEQVRTQKVPGKFTGDLIVTPDAMSDFIGFLINSVSNASMIAGTSLYKDRIGESVASSALTIHSRPLDLPAGYRFTSDGFVAENMTLLDEGVLKSYLLDLYGARKTGLERAVGGGCWVVDPGSSSLDEIIADTAEGVLIARFSGGRPNEKGDFSGVAKNSYYVKDGKVQYPISETMISGNLADALNSVSAVSSERADFGHAVLPWMKLTGIGIS